MATIRNDKFSKYVIASKSLIDSVFVCVIMKYNIGILYRLKTVIY